MAKIKVANRPPPPELVAEYENAKKWVIHFEENGNTHSYYHGVLKRLEPIIKKWEVTNGTSD